ncbi:MAG: helix-turn-helix domain-containing protein [Syntrophobacteraceae bacterium]|nr:helix-turn-helix domain-containing protein [Syntrophobacteraceae bacterium]
MSVLKPGTKIRGSESGSPINAIFDLMGRRWALGILWYLGDGPLKFRELQDRCGGVSPSILNRRLKELREADIVARTVDGYILTERGKELRLLIVPVAKWSVDWSKEVYGYERPGMGERLAKHEPTKN